MTAHSEPPLGTPTTVVTSRRGLGWPVVAIAAVAGTVLGLFLGAILWLDDDVDPVRQVVGEETTTTDGDGDDGGPVGDGENAAGSGDGTTASIGTPCLDSLDRLEDALDLIDRGISAIQRFDGSELNDVVGTLDDLVPEVRESAERCRDEIVEEE